MEVGEGRMEGGEGRIAGGVGDGTCDGVEGRRWPGGGRWGGLFNRSADWEHERWGTDWGGGTAAEDSIGDRCAAAAAVWWKGGRGGVTVIAGGSGWVPLEADGIWGGILLLIWGAGSC